MKRIQSLGILLLFFLLTLNESYSQRDRLELGVRYIKLGNSYRESGNFDKSIEYLEKGKNLVENRSEYWLAVSKEYYGYLFRDMGRSKQANGDKRMFMQNALESFNEALAIYKRIISQSDGSPMALESIMMNIHSLQDEMASFNDERSNHDDDRRAIAGDGADVLNFDRQKLRDVPSNLPRNTRNLSLSENRFSDFPSSLSEYRQLEYLDLSYNRIKNIPSSISNFSNLHWLDLSGNRIKEIPSSIGDLNNLTELNLEGNRLKDLPPSICQLQRLRVLNIRNNKLPFEKIANIIKCLPNTNVLFDEYILKEFVEEE